eukprot:CAMPEP_0119322094 /NCGR_PEP_ID=MMETSP1333-20130426/57272_1 /TAXON_ID=418940 /ORGANISM="Scyphosphaera apsteinii, Strain RCC1455" /LENGTH=299 /DNA_ID=CAMNT_0007329237 /DNA_START=97 /DNA_END=996 /DNA_ORIENTATION=-
MEAATAASLASSSQPEAVSTAEFSLKPQARWPPRAVWAALHVCGLALLEVSGGWPKEGMLVWMQPLLFAMTAVLYMGASFRNPGYAEQPPRDLATALLYQPCAHCGAPLAPRTKHCHDCCRCVRRMDHHCWWLGNCVGERTHCNFVGYLLVQTLLLVITGILAISRCVIGLGEQDQAEVPAPLALFAAVLCAALCLLTGLAALTLLLFQVALVLRGETTWERLRRPQLNAAAKLKPDARPYDRGVARNIFIFCGCESDPGCPAWEENSEWQRAKYADSLCLPVSYAAAQPISGTMHPVL